MGFRLRPRTSAILADRTHSRRGKFRPYLLFLAVPFALIGILTFTTPQWSLTAKIIYAYATYSLMMMVYSAINVPYASLLGVISADPHDRNLLAVYRMLFAYLGSFIALLLFMPMVNVFSRGHSEQYGWMMAVVVIAVACAALFYGCFALTRERVKPIKEVQNPLKEDLKDLFHNRPWWILLGAGIAAWCSTPSATVPRCTISNTSSSKRTMKRFPCSDCPLC